MMKLLKKTAGPQALLSAVFSPTFFNEMGQHPRPLALKAGAAADGDDDSPASRAWRAAYAAWKRERGVPPDARVFLIGGAYPAVRAAMLARGWRENREKGSAFFDLAWTTKTDVLDALRPGQRLGEPPSTSLRTLRVNAPRYLQGIFHSAIRNALPQAIQQETKVQVFIGPG